MHFFLKALPLLALTAAHPIENRGTIETRALSDNDTAVLSLALYLEHLEYALYSGAYETFSDADFTAAGFPAGFHDNVGVIASHEQTHATLIAQTLSENGVSPIPACTYSFPYTDPKSFAALANMVSSVGVGAYIGGGLELTDNTLLLQTASSIVTVEARHITFLRDGIGASPFPTAFDTALTALWSFNLAQMFIVSCPEQLPGQVVLPKLNLTSPTPPENLQPPTPAGTTLDFAWDPSQFFVPVDPNAPLYIAFINQVSAPVFVEVTKGSTAGTGSVALPAGVEGIAFGVLTTFSGGLSEMDLSSFGTLAGPVEIALA